ncbi:MAG: hypothetical protein NC408_09740 [Candidatus Gastranaerophilales bacterium]|nr:hypothetical protein [Candidatus Gastranaerophilales bacterium]
MLLKVYNIKNYPSIIRQLKTHFSQNFDISKIEDYELTQSNIDKQERDIWQRRYFEHTIVYQEDFYRHIDYIHYNSVQHDCAKSPKDWEFSSFQKFADRKYYDIDWCNGEDKYNIKDLVWE